MQEGGLTGSSPTPEALAAQGERLALLNLAVLALPYRQAILIRLRYSHGMTLRQVGLVFGVSEAAVCQMERRALVNMRAALGRLGVGYFREL